MSKPIVEVEIKIEYCENSDQDPLDDEVQDSESSELFQDHESKLALQKNMDSKGFIDFEIPQIGQEETTWYKKTDNKFLCKFCDCMYTATQSLWRHIGIKHPAQMDILTQTSARKTRKRRSKCHFCEKRYSDVTKLERHVSLNHKLEELEYCLMKEKNLDNIECSQTDNNNPKDEKSKRKKYCRKKSVTCPYCGQVLSRVDSLKVHIVTKHNTEADYKYACSICPYKAPIKYYLKTHIAHKHRNTELAKNELGKSELIHACKLCGYTTIKKSHFFEHQRTHDRSSKYSCDLCDFRTAKKYNLSVHARVHTKEKPYTCTFEGCNYKCNSKSGLGTHQYLHENQVYFYCDKCTYKTVYKQSLNRHYETHNNS